jgi:hypothetical protein
MDIFIAQSYQRCPARMDAKFGGAHHTHQLVVSTVLDLNDRMRINMCTSTSVTLIW